MSRFKRPSSLSSLLSDVTQDLGITRRLDETQIEETWKSVAGVQAARVTRRVRMNRSVLTVYLTDATWRHALHAQRKEWRVRLNEALGHELVSEIVFR
ncbi:MAG: putative nucleic acid-binding Zn ribbon protein [Rhodothermales bacterium]|jgi:predicted nucleic acid-binding Zn ribbon protein